jgi:hypothetical protein
VREPHGIALFTGALRRPRIHLSGVHDPLHDAGANSKLAGDLEDADLLLSQLADFRQQLWIVAARATWLCALARAGPELTRSRIISLSNSLKTPSI